MSHTFPRFAYRFYNFSQNLQYNFHPGDEETGTVSLAPRGTTRERLEELNADENLKLSFVPKFISAAEAILPGTDSDYDTDIEVEDVYKKLEDGIENIYEGTGRIMYEASCKTEGVVPISYIINR